MTDTQDRDQDALDRVSAAEREVLLMLARGHTAKTIAHDLAVSVAAVNERLRSARRKTGAGSSRELARRLAQADRENRDEFSGVAAQAGSGLRRDRPAPQGRRITRRTVMIASTGIVAALALSLTPHLIDQEPGAAPARSAADAEVIARLSSGPDPRALRDRLDGEARHAAWAPATEAKLRESYGRLPAAARSLETLSITCKTTVCEVVGRSRAAASGDDVATLMTEVQSGEMIGALDGLGLRTIVSSFTADPANPQAMAFVVYLER
jgi:DNA-binding CsgD family transcriptional regulator